MMRTKNQLCSFAKNNSRLFLFISKPTTKEITASTDAERISIIKTKVSERIYEIKIPVK